jgi:transcription initiation factor TFIID subunit 5
MSDVDCVRFHPNMRYLLTGSSDRTMRMWDTASGKCVRVFTGHSAAIRSIAISHSGKYLASAGDDKTIRLWDIAQGTCVTPMAGHENAIYSLDFSWDDRLVISGGADNSVRVWNAAATLADPIKDAVVDEGKDARLLGTFFTKSTPVYHTCFTRRNLALAIGAFVE